MNVNPKIDLVFKKLFATEENKDLINTVLLSHPNLRKIYQL